MARMRLLGALLLVATSLVAPTACHAGPTEPTQSGPGSLTLDPSAWPNPSATPDGALIATGLTVDKRELVLAFSRLPSPADTLVQQAAWLDHTTRTLALVANPNWGWHRPGVQSGGVQTFTQIMTSAGLLEYGYAHGPAARVTIESAGQRVSAGVAAWGLDPTVVAFWSLHDGSPTRHDSSASERPVVTVLDSTGSEVDHQVLTEPPSRTDG
jgi:hypothetical protein